MSTKKPLLHRAAPDKGRNRGLRKWTQRCALPDPVRLWCLARLSEDARKLNESTSCFAVFILNGGEVMVDEAHPPVQLRQPVKNVLVKAEKTHYRVA